MGSIFISLLLCLAPFFVHGQFLKAGDIRVYANAMVSSQLNAEMARQYGISRSASRALLHVVVRKGTPGQDKTLPATIKAVAIRKSGERRKINMQITREGQNVYYLGELNIAKNEAVNFEIIAQVEKQKPMRMTFLQQFFSQ